jgi:hypothetical protein
MVKRPGSERAQVKPAARQRAAKARVRRKGAAAPAPSASAQPLSVGTPNNGQSSIPHPASASQPHPSPAAPIGMYRARIRMYRQGLGDCFLISLKRNTENAADFRILIDCGVVLGTPNPQAIMVDVVNDIVQETSGKIDILIITHEHWDHLSGFIQAEDCFKNLATDQVWVAWTEDPTDALAVQLGAERDGARLALQRSVQALAAAGADEQAQTVSNLLGFFGAAAEGSTKDAFDRAKKMGTLRFCRPTDSPVRPSDVDAHLYILGPPHDAGLIRRTLLPNDNPELYGLSADRGGAMPADVHAALSGNSDFQPFNDLYSIPFDIAKGIEFFQSHYFGPSDDAPSWRSIGNDWLDSASDLALALDGATNNTSLVLAIELQGGDVLLFVADAQVGNWESWQSLSWTVDGRNITGPDLLHRTIFYKVGHHGSHNATLRTRGLEDMANLELAAIPVDHEMAVKKGWGQMPLPALVQALIEKTNGKLLRSDVTPPVMERVIVKPLYFEITF